MVEVPAVGVVGVNAALVRRGAGAVATLIVLATYFFVACGRAGVVFVVFLGAIVDCQVNITMCELCICISASDRIFAHNIYRRIK